MLGEVVEDEPRAGRAETLGAPYGILSRELLVDVFGVQARLLRDQVGASSSPLRRVTADLPSVPLAVR